MSLACLKIVSSIDPGTLPRKSFSCSLNPGPFANRQKLRITLKTRLINRAMFANGPFATLNPLGFWGLGLGFRAVYVMVLRDKP